MGAQALHIVTELLLQVGTARPKALGADSQIIGAVHPSLQRLRQLSPTRFFGGEQPRC